jgi:REP element-mobilizing transposase RayT
MVIQFDPNVSVDAMVKTFKRTNKDMKKEYPDLDEFHMGNTFWADGYFAATEGCYDEQAVREYIAECQCEF